MIHRLIRFHIDIMKIYGVRTEDEIVKSMREKYNAPDGVIERDVKKVLDNLHEIGALID